MLPAAGHGVAVAAATLLVCTALGSTAPGACEPREEVSLLSTQEDDVALLSLTTQVHVRSRRRKREVAVERPPRRQVREEQEEEEEEVAAKEPEPPRRGHAALLKEPPVEDPVVEPDPRRAAEELPEPQTVVEEPQVAAEEAAEPPSAEPQVAEPQVSEPQEPQERKQRQQQPQQPQHPQHRKRQRALPSESALFAASDSVIEVPVLLLFAGVVLLAAVGALLLFWIVEHVPPRKRTRPTEAAVAKTALQDHPMDKSFLFHVLSSIESKKKTRAYTAEVLSKGPPPKIVDEDSSDDCSTLPRPERTEPESEADEGEVRQQRMAEADWALQIALCDARPPATLPRHLDVGALAVLSQVLAERQRRQER